MPDWFDGMRASASCTLVTPALTNSSALMMVSGLAVSACRRLIDDPVISTRCMAGAAASCAMAETLMAAPAANMAFRDSDNTVGFIIPQTPVGQKSYGSIAKHAMSILKRWSVFKYNKNATLHEYAS